MVKVFFNKWMASNRMQDRLFVLYLTLRCYLPNRNVEIIESNEQRIRGSKVSVWFDMNQTACNEDVCSINYIQKKYTFFASVHWMAMWWDISRWWYDWQTRDEENKKREGKIKYYSFFSDDNRKLMCDVEFLVLNRLFPFTYVKVSMFNYEKLNVKLCFLHIMKCVHVQASFLVFIIVSFLKKHTILAITRNYEEITKRNIF